MSSSSSSSRSSLWTSPPTSDVNFVYVLEDANIEKEILEKIHKDNPSSSLRVLVPCSSGDSAIALSSLPFVSEVFAVDILQSQIHLAEIKLKLFTQFNDITQFIDFFSNPPFIHGQSEEEREKSLKSLREFRESQFKILSKNLSEPCVAYWTENSRFSRWVNEGFYSFGFRQRDIIKMGEQLREKERNYEFEFPLHWIPSPSENEKNPSPLRPFLNSKFFNSPKHIEFFKNYWETSMINISLPNGFSLKGGKHIGGVVLKSLTVEWERTGGGESPKEGKFNWFIRSFFEMNHPAIPIQTEDEMPLYLQNFPSKVADDSKEISQRISKISTKLQNIIHHLEGKNPYDFIHLSTILDGVSPSDRVSLLQNVWNNLSPHGYLLCRTGPFANEMNSFEEGEGEGGGKGGERKIRGLLRKMNFEVMSEWSDKLREKEMTQIYFDVVVARKKGGQ